LMCPRYPDTVRYGLDYKVHLSAGSDFDLSIAVIVSTRRNEKGDCT